MITKTLHIFFKNIFLNIDSWVGYKVIDFLRLKEISANISNNEIIADTNTGWTL